MVANGRRSLMILIALTTGEHHSCHAQVIAINSWKPDSSDSRIQRRTAGQVPTEILSKKECVFLHGNTFPLLHNLLQVGFLQELNDL